MLKIILSILFSTLLFGNTLEKLSLKIKNIKSNKGFIHIAVIDNIETYKKAIKFDPNIEPVMGMIMKATTPSLSIQLNLDKNKIYSILVFHDKNNNKKINLGFFGPLEPYGFSNDAIGFFAPPKYKQTLINLNKTSSYNQFTLTLSM